jgi:hypothetical protein
VDLHHTRQIQWCVLKVLLHLDLIHAVASLPLHSRVVMSSTPATFAG